MREMSHNEAPLSTFRASFTLALPLSIALLMTGVTGQNTTLLFYVVTKEGGPFVVLEVIPTRSHLM